MMTCTQQRSESDRIS